MNKTYVRKDDHGGYRVSESRIMLESIVTRFREGDSPETIRENYPVLSLEDVYGAITFYLAHRQEVDAYVQGRETAFEGMRTEAENDLPPVVQRLRRLKDSKASSTP